jgi:hypothetical protein
MYQIELYVDGVLMAAWACQAVGSAAVPVHRSTLAADQEREGCYLHTLNGYAVRQLMEKWGIAGEPPPMDKTYFPRDGVHFLLAVYATYCRGSRVWATPGQGAPTNQKPEPAAEE